jgi:hypothetical protein
MQKLQTIRELNDIKIIFNNNEHDLQTISHLITIIRGNKYNLGKENIRKLLEIPLDVLEHDVELKKESEFIKFGSYFSGNIRTSNDMSILKFKDIFENHEHTLQDIVDFTKAIYNRINVDEKMIYEIEFLLRNPEVVIRDDINLYRYSNFNKSGSIFALYIDNVIMNMMNKVYEVNSQKEGLHAIERFDDIEYDIALSFAGEDRERASELANSLNRKGIKVFYDYYEIDTLWGKDLYEYLSKIYRDQAKFCIMFLSDNYAKKLWTNHERKNAQARAFKESREYILPIRLDNTTIPGINDTIGYINYNDYSVDEIAEIIIKKIKSL